MTALPKENVSAVDHSPNDNVVPLDGKSRSSAAQSEGHASKRLEPELTIDEVTVLSKDGTRQSTSRSFRLSREVKWALGLIGLTIVAAKWKEIAVTVSAIGRQLGY